MHDTQVPEQERASWSQERPHVTITTFPLSPSFLWFSTVPPVLGVDGCQEANDAAGIPFILASITDTWGIQP
jgi:hypothetical protein